MKRNLTATIAAITLFAALALPVQLAAQQTRYKFIDIGTFGGPNSSPAFQPFFDFTTAQNLSNTGTFIGQAELSTPGTCFLNEDCLVQHAFQWRNGVFTDLGSLAEGLSSAAEWVAGNGFVAGVSEYIDPATSAPESRAVLWKKGGVVNLGTLPRATREVREIGFPDSIAFAVNNNGHIVGMSTNDTADPNPNMFTDTVGDPEPRAVLWQGNHIRDLGTLGGTDSVALLINEQGQVVGQSYTADTNQPAPFCGGGVPLNLHGFIWEDGVMTDIGTLGGSCAFTYSLNNRGQIVGQSAVAGDAASHPYLWDPRLGIIDLFQRDRGTIGGSYGYAQWINDAGAVVGSVTNQGDQALLAVLWTPDGAIHNLGALDGDPCSATDAINSKGQVVGGSGFYAADFFPACTTAVEHAFLWENGTMLDLNAFVPVGSDLTLNEAVFINDRGVISGFATNANGDQRAFLLIPCGSSNTEGCEGGTSATTATRVNPATVQAPTTANRSITRFRGSANRIMRPFGRRLMPLHR
jgi:probable HAF family extracellular repeat protein